MSPSLARVASAFRRKIWVGTSLLVVTACASAPPQAARKPDGRSEQAVARQLDQIFNAPITDHALWAVEVKSLDTGRVWYARNPRTLVMPASNMKIVTLAAAAETLGWDHRFKTTLETIGTIENGVLRGDLIIRGGGDPTINKRNDRATAVFDEWAAALKAAGITRIAGNVVGDATRFHPIGLGQGWSWDYLEAGYAAPASALEFNENIATLSIAPGAKPGDDAPLQLAVGAGLGLVHHVVTGAPGTPTRINLRRLPEGGWLDVAGSIASDAQPVTRDVAVARPALYFAHSTLTALVARGLQVQGLPKEEPVWLNTMVAPRTSIVLAETSSPPLRDIATTMMKVSQNLYAETLLRAIGTVKSTEPASADAGLDAARAVFTNWGIPANSYVLADGSGLSRYDFVTADMIVRILERLHSDPRHRDTFVATLPIAGKDGTISTRMRATRAEGNAIAKTGSIANVRALSGYVKTREGETLVFAIIGNNFTVPAATITWMSDLAVETLANAGRR